MNKCLICANPLGNEENYHPKCARKLFGSKDIPKLAVRMDELSKLAKKSVHARVTVPGVQTKLYLDCRKENRGS